MVCMVLSHTHTFERNSSFLVVLKMTHGSVFTIFPAACDAGSAASISAVRCEHLLGFNCLVFHPKV